MKRSAKVSKVSCTPEQRLTACRFLERIIDAEQIIGTAYDHSIHNEVLLDINEKYHAAICGLLEVQERLTSQQKASEDWPFSTAVVDEQMGFVLNINHVMKNGEFNAQSQSPDFLFAVNGRNAVAYTLARSGKSKATITVYFGNRYADNDVVRYRQRIELLMGHLWNVAFRCPFCEENVAELYVSHDSSAFGCVACHTALNAEEAARYQRTIQRTATAKKGGVQ